MSTTLVSCAWFPGGGWCGPDGYTDRQQRASFGIQGQLPSTSPFDMIDDGPTSVNVSYRETHGNTTGLSYGLAMFTSCAGGRPCCLVLFVKEIKTRRHTHLLDFRDKTCLIQASTLQRPQLRPGALW